MKNQNQTIENFNDLVFENRNKAYGAYVMRQSYHQNVSKSLLVSMLFFSLLVLVGVLLSGNQMPKIKLDNIQKLDSLVSTAVDVTPPEKPKLMEPTKLKELVKPKTYVLIVEVKDKKEDASIKTNENAKIDPKGELNGKDSIPVKEDFTVKTNNKGIDLNDKNEDPKLVADVMPEFRGDLFRYLSENMRYPRMAVEALTQGTVYLTFVVEKNGDIGDIKVLKAVSEGCTEEAIRVVKSMPKWNPGKNHGQPVRVQYNLPVKFRLR